MLARICDECGKVMNAKEEVVRLYAGAIDHKTGQPGKMNPVSEKDYCEECVSGIMAAIRGEKKTSASKTKSKTASRKEPASKSTGVESKQKSV